MMQEGVMQAMLPDRLTINGVDYVRSGGKRACRECHYFEGEFRGDPTFTPGDGESFCGGYEQRVFAADIRQCFKPRLEQLPGAVDATD